MRYLSNLLCITAASFLTATARGDAAASGDIVTDGLTFFETFDEGNVFDSGKWVKSSHSKYHNQPIMVKTLDSAPDGFGENKVLLLTQEMKHYGFGSKFPEPFDPTHRDIVLQYEVKLEEGLTCGGAYLKMLRAGPDFTGLENLNNDSPYSIMFGPDKCGGNNKVHFIMQHQSPITKEWEEKHFNETQPIRSDRKTHLYTLHIGNQNNSFEMYIDMISVRKGSLFTHMDPPINPPEEIDDPSDKKPSDWVDEPEMPDPSAFKPVDWDESAPRKIPDPDATKPANWLDNEPELIPDPEAHKPGDWDDEEDGEWVAPEVPNPTCGLASSAGCGQWQPPMIPNPDYRGKWKAPMIPNPHYKGPWAPRKIPNPAYFLDTHPASSIAPMVGLAVEIWTTNAAIAFDNFVVADSLPAAFDFARSTFVPKAEAEAEALARVAAQQREEERTQKLERGGFKEQLVVYLQDAADYFAANPLALFGTAAAVFLGFVLLVVAGVRNGPETQQQPSHGNSSSDRNSSSDGGDIGTDTADADADANTDGTVEDSTAATENKE